MTIFSKVSYALVLVLLPYKDMLKLLLALQMIEMLLQGNCTARPSAWGIMQPLLVASDFPSIFTSTNEHHSFPAPTTSSHTSFRSEHRIGTNATHSSALDALPTTSNCIAWFLLSQSLYSHISKSRWPVKNIIFLSKSPSPQCKKVFAVI